MADNEQQTAANTGSSETSQIDKRDQIILEFIKSEHDLEFKKNRVIKLLAQARQRSLTLAENKELNQLREELKEAMTSDSASGSSPASFHGQKFDNLLAVAAYLKSQGYKLGKSTLYNHHAAGKIAPDTDGKYTQGAVDKYAAMALKRIDGAATTPRPVASDLDRISVKRAEDEGRKIAAQAMLFEQKAAILQDSYIPRSVHEQELAARAAVLVSDGKNFVHSEAPAIVAMVGGDPAKIPDLVDFMLTALGQWFSRYSQAKEFSIDPKEYSDILAESSVVTEKEED